MRGEIYIGVIRAWLTLRVEVRCLFFFGFFAEFARSFAGAGGAIDAQEKTEYDERVGKEVALGLFLGRFVLLREGRTGGGEPDQQREGKATKPAAKAGERRTEWGRWLVHAPMIV